jgi:hypothetical protein
MNICFPSQGPKNKPRRIHVLEMELGYLPYDTPHIPGFSEEDSGVRELVMMSKIDAVPRHDQISH